MAEGQLLLWGEVRVGKTTLLTTGLLAYPERLPAFDWNAEPVQDKKRVLRCWRRLKENQPLEQTVLVESLTLPLREGGALTVRDIQGILTRQPLDEPTFRQAGPARGVLFVCEWQGADIAQHMAAIEAGLPLCHDVHVGLAITKAERGMAADDPHWLAPPRWWREHDGWRPYARILERFEDRVWPTSSYGFDAEGRPACLLGEFGQVVPYRIAPVNVEAPFRWFLGEFGLWQG